MTELDQKQLGNTLWRSLVQKIETAQAKHNAFLKELGLSLLP